MPINIAIDGPSGAGKSTLSRRVAQHLGYLYLDTGALYRAVALHIIRGGDLSDCDVSFQVIDGTQHVYLGTEDVSDAIRAHEISQAASDQSKRPEVRDFLLALQRDTAASHNVVMDGRDIGTTILPHADVKIFLTAAAETRARRRCLELEERTGVAPDFAEILADIRARDHQDETRPIAPLKPSSDAVILDTSTLTFEESLAKLLEMIQRGIFNHV